MDPNTNLDLAGFKYVLFDAGLTLKGDCWAVAEVCALPSAIVVCVRLFIWKDNRLRLK